MTERHYVHVGGEEGRDRLRVLARIFAPATAALLDRIEIVAGMRCLDIGCGGGDVSVELARRVGPRGAVTAIDFDGEALEIARREAVQAGLDNLTYRHIDWSGPLGADKNQAADLTAPRGPLQLGGQNCTPKHSLTGAICRVGLSGALNRPPSASASDACPAVRTPSCTPRGFFCIGTNPAVSRCCRGVPNPAPAQGAPLRPAAKPPLPGRTRGAFSVCGWLPGKALSAGVVDCWAQTRRLANSHRENGRDSDDGNQPNQDDYGVVISLRYGLCAKPSPKPDRHFRPLFPSPWLAFSTRIASETGVDAV